MMPQRQRRVRRIFLPLGLVGVIVGLGVVAIHATRTTLRPLGIPGKWHLVLDSEFNGSSLNTKVWRAGWFGTGVTPPVNTLEDDCYNTNNVVLSGAALHLNVTHRPSTCKGHSYPYTGALIDTDPSDGRKSGGFQYTYGVLEARVYLPANGSALADWPAVWAVAQGGSSSYGEDDVIEGLAGIACWHFHQVSSELGRCDTAIKPGWHTVASDWKKGSVTFYYDGIKVGSITSGISSGPMFLLLDNTTTADGPIPDSMRVKYVRVWRRES